MPASELFISEYIEGSSFNKAIEIFNGTGAAVDLEALGYSLELYSNGAASPSQTLELSGTIADGDVFVLAHPSADAAILAAADVTNGAVINFNGDDAVVLRRSGATIDVIGQIGFDPGTEWGSGLTSTADNTLRRLPTILQGDADGADAFDPAIEWAGFAQNTFDGLGFHAVTTGGTPIVAIAATDAAAAEQGTDPGTFRITRTGDTTNPLTVSYTIGGTATNGADYTPNLNGTATIAAGQSFADITITPVDDSDNEGAETVILTLVDGAAYDLGAIAAATVSIADNDARIAVTKIHDVQGSGAASPLVGKVVTVEAIVVGDFQNGDADAARNLGGFYLQEEDTDADGSAATSEGIFVFQGSGTSPINVAIGDRVQVTGTVAEFQGETQIATVTGVTVLSSGNPLPTAAQINLPAAAVTLNQNGDYQPDIEAYEGMRVELPQTLTINEMFQLDRFNEIKLVAGDRPQQFTQFNAPDAAGYAAYLRSVGAVQITYDDGLNLQNAAIGNLDGFGPTFSTASDIRIGDTVTGLSGVLDYKWAGNSASGSTWRVRATENGENAFVKANERPDAPDDVGGPLKVASFNVLNYFTTLDDFRANNSNPLTAIGLEPRGANDFNFDGMGLEPGSPGYVADTREFERQTEKLVDAIIGLDADILGLIELENDFLPGSPGNAVAFLVGEINATLGFDSYTWVNPGQQFIDGSDAISVGLIYRIDAVSIAPGTSVAILTDADLKTLGVDPGVPVFDGPSTSRAPLAVSFAENASGSVFTVAVNHLKSKGSPGTAGAADVDQGDGAGAGNQTRLNGVIALDAWLDTDPTGSGDDDFLLLGDFNAYAKEDPITFLEGQGYVDLARAFGGPDVYSYVFDGQVGTLDYAFASASLFSQVTGATEWHINADEADALDYNLDFGRDPLIFDGTVPFRTSDHDPVLVGLDLAPLLVANSHIEFEVRKEFVGRFRKEVLVAELHEGAADGIDTADKHALQREFFDAKKIDGNADIGGDDGIDLVDIEGLVFDMDTGLTETIAIVSSAAARAADRGAGLAEGDVIEQRVGSVAVSTANETRDPNGDGDVPFGTGFAIDADGAGKRGGYGGNEGAGTGGNSIDDNEFLFIALTGDDLIGLAVSFSIDVLAVNGQARDPATLANLAAARADLTVDFWTGNPDGTFTRAQSTTLTIEENDIVAVEASRPFDAVSFRAADGGADDHVRIESLEISTYSDLFLV